MCSAASVIRMVKNVSRRLCFSRVLLFEFVLNLPHTRLCAPRAVKPWARGRHTVYRIAQRARPVCGLVCGCIRSLRSSAGAARRQHMVGMVSKSRLCGACPFVGYFGLFSINYFRKNMCAAETYALLTPGLLGWRLFLCAAATTFVV
jgi:hypothetical protein